MILTDRQIEQACLAGNIVISPFDAKQIQPASYDFRVGEQGATTSARKLVNIKQQGYLSLEPGDFGIVTVLEEVRLGPRYAGRLGLRSKFARKGLIATTGPQVDPGFHGRLIVGITNLTPRPVSLAFKDDFITVEFHQLEEAPTKPYNGPYQDKLELGPEEIEFVVEREGMALNEVLTTLRSLSQNVGALTTEMKTFRWLMPLIVVVGFTVVAIIVAIKK